MALIHVDVLTPKQALFLGEVIKALKKRNHDILVTTRKYREAEEMLQLLKIKPTVVGQYGKDTLEGKLKASLSRTADLSVLLRRDKPTVSLSFSSPEAARASFGLAIPHICISDSPHAEATSKLAIPLSEKLLTPWIIPKKAWLKVGAREDMVEKYRALDPVVWIRGYKVNSAVIKQLDISRGDTIVTVRPEESYAAYLLKRVKNLTTPTIVKKLLKVLGDRAKVVVLPRYDDQASVLKEKLDDKVIVPEKTVDGCNLLTYSTAFIGSGGTMTAESALLGVPTFSCYPSQPTYVDRYLIRQKLIRRLTKPDTLVKEVAHVLQNSDKFRASQSERAKRLVAWMEDPVKRIVNVTSSYL
jgi:predicted glycosyltransferase